MAALSILLGPGVAKADPPACMIGMDVADLHNLDPRADTFDAKIWIWSVCPDGVADPLTNLSFDSARNVETSSYTRELSNGSQWGVMLASGTFRQHFDTRAFPFDKQALHVLVTAYENVTDMRLLPDTGQTAYDPAVPLSGWRAGPPTLEGAERVYSTSFGDPAAVPGATNVYSQITLTMELRRSDGTMFWKLIGPMLISFLVALLTMAVAPTTVRSMQGRAGVLGAALFTTMINLQRANDVVPSNAGLTLIDQLHILTLAYVFLGLVVMMLCWRWTQIEDDTREAIIHAKSDDDWVDSVRALGDTLMHRIRTLSKVAAIAGTSIYILIAAALIAVAMRAGA